MKWIFLVLAFLVSFQVSANCPVLKGTYSCGPDFRFRIEESSVDDEVSYVFHALQPKEASWVHHYDTSQQWVEAQSPEFYLPDGELRKIKSGELKDFDVGSICEEEALVIVTVPPATSTLPFKTRVSRISINHYGGLIINNRYWSIPQKTWVEEVEACPLVISNPEETTRSVIEMVVFRNENGY